MVYFSILLASIYLNNCEAIHDSLNFLLSPKSRQCFFEDFDSNSPPRILEAFVQSGGNLDVKLIVHGPLELDEIRLEKFEKPIIQERIDAAREYDSETQTFQMHLKPSLPGTYAICLDNRHSYMSSKLVQLDLRSGPRVKPIVLSSRKDGTEEEIAISNAKETLDRLYKGVTDIMVMQQRDRHRLSLHSETNVIDHNKVVSGSIVETAVFIVAALFQIFFVRRWFVSRNAPKQRA